MYMGRGQVKNRKDGRGDAKKKGIRGVSQSDTWGGGKRAQRYLSRNRVMERDQKTRKSSQANLETRQYLLVNNRSGWRGGQQKNLLRKGKQIVKGMRDEHRLPTLSRKPDKKTGFKEVFFPLGWNRSTLSREGRKPKGRYPQLN